MIKKRAVIWSLTMFIIFLICGAASAGSPAPENVSWKENSTATTARDAVEGADDYRVTETIQATDNGITATFVIPRANAYIGQRYPIHYELSGGSNEFNEVSIQTIISTAWGSGSGSAQRTNSGEGDWEVVIASGEELTINVYGADSEGRSFYIELGRRVQIEPNPDYPVTVTMNTVEDESGYSYIADYRIEGTELFTGTGSWTIGENGEYSSNVQTVQLDAPEGQIALSPTFGDSAYLVIQGETADGKPVYITEGPISIMTPETQEITVSFSSDEENAYIGHPYTIHYEIKGGTGVYQDLHVSRFFEYGCGSGHGNSEVLTGASGDITVIPTDGVNMRIAVSGNDSSGKKFYIYGRDIPIRPNPDYPIQFSFGTDSFVIMKDYQVAYSISNADSISGIASWTIGTVDSNSRNIQSKEICESTGMISFTPAFGDKAWLVIKGETQNGDKLYYESDAIDILNSESIPEFGTPDFVIPSATSTIEDSAFEGAAMKIVLIPSGCRTIGNEAFKDCRSLEQIKIPGDCAVGEDAFAGCLKVFIYGSVGSPAEEYCQTHNNCVFVEEP